MPTDATIIAIDVGNTSVHLGSFLATTKFPTAESTLTLSSADFHADQLAAWFPVQATNVFLASVFRDAERRMCEWLRENRPDLSLTVIRSADFARAISVLVDSSSQVGADRVAAAVAANALRNPKHAAIVVDSGTAITIDAIDSAGRFLGGAIAPGWRVSADALHRVADLLPLIEPVEQCPPAIGKNTEAAIRSGLYWGAIGLVRELIAEMQRTLDCDCDIFVTGGGALMLAERLEHAFVQPDLVLSGIVLAGRVLAQSSQSDPGSY